MGSTSSWRGSTASQTIAATSTSNNAPLWSPVDDAKITIHPAADSIVDMFVAHSGCFVMVLGAAGTGKTFPSP